MKEVTVRAWCDGCAAEIEDGGDVEPAIVEVAVSIGLVTERPADRKSLDLCERHDKALLEPLRALLAESGQDPGTTPQTAGKRPGRRTGPEPKHPDRFPCLWCPESYGALGGYVGHLVRAHGLKPGSTIGGVYGTRCPIDGRTMANGSALGTHGRIVHDAVSIADLFRLAAAAGDPHGLVVKVKRKGRT